MGGTSQVYQRSITARTGSPPQSWLCQPQLAPVFSFDLAPSSWCEGREFSFDLAPPIRGLSEARGRGLGAGGLMSETAFRLAWVSWVITSPPMRPGRV